MDILERETDGHSYKSHNYSPMVAGLGYRQLLKRGQSPLNVTAEARVSGFKKKYP
jgi:hypothetical protein